MSQWNLSVRLTGQGSGLSRTLRDLSRDATQASRRVDQLRRDIVQLRASAARPITVRLDVDGAHLRRDVNAALTTAGAGQGIRVRLDLDADHLRSEVNAALTAAGAGQGLSVNLRIADPMQLRREVENAVRWAAWGHRIDIPIGLQDPMQLRRDVSAAVRWASMNQTIRIRVDADTSALNGLNRIVNRGGGGNGNDGIRGLLTGLLTLAPAAIPLVAGLSANLAPLAGQFAAAGAGAAAFGIALSGQIEPMQDLTKAQDKYDKAVSEHGAHSEQAAKAQLAYQQQLAAMPPETQKAAIALSRLNTTFSGWSDDMSQFTMVPVTKSFQLLERVLPSLSPEVKSFSSEMDRLLNVLGGTVNSPWFDAIAEKAGKLTQSKLDDFTDQVIHLLRVVSDGQIGDGPLQQILDYARENGPAAREAIKAIGEAIGTLAEGASQAGPSMLTLVTAAARLVAALPPEAVAVILQIAAAIKLVQLASAGSTAAATAVSNLMTRIRELGAVSATAGGGIAGLRAALASLSTGAKVGAAVAAVGALIVALHEMSDNKPAVEVDKLSTSLNTLISTGKTSGVLKTNLDDIASSIAIVSKGASDNKFAQWTSDFGTWIGVAKGPGISTARENVEAWDKSMADLVRAGHPKEAAAQYELLKKAWKAGGGDMDRLTKFTDDYNSALADQRFEQQMTAQSMGLFGRQALEVQAQLDAQKQSADGLRQSILALNDANRSAYDSQIQFEAAVDDLSASFKKNGATLDINTEKGRNNATAMSAAAKANDEMLAAGIAAGESLGSMTKKSDGLRATMERLARSTGMTKTEAQNYVNTLLGTPDQIKTMVKLERQDAIAGLQAVQAEIAKTPSAKSVRVDTLNAAAIAALEAVGLKTRQLPDGKTEVYTANGQALGNITAVERALNNLNGKTANTYTNNYTTNTITTVRRERAEASTLNRPYSGEGNLSKSANGAVWDYYANGGVRGREQHIAQIAPAGTMRVWAEPETQGEGYVPFAKSKRVRSRAITEEIVRRLGGDPTSIQWYANGGIAGVQHFASGGFTYTPSAAVKSASDVQSAYSDTHQPIDKAAYDKAIRARANAVDALRAAEAKLAQVRRQKHTRSQLISAENAVAKARRSLATATDVAKSAEARYRKAFSLSDWQKTLSSTVRANAAYEANLARIASRGGADVVEQLRGMGAEGANMVAALAKASKAQFNSIVADLRRLAPTAKATLADYTKQLQTSTGLSKTFQSNLLKLASMGYGDLAAQLAGQGDDTAMAIAASAVKDTKAAAAANAAAKANAGLMTSDDIATAVTVLTVLKNKQGAGIADVLAAGVDWPTLKALAPKIMSQVKALPAVNRDLFLKQLAGQGVTAMARGGILTGPTLVLGGEAGVPESWIPQDGSVRSKKLLAQTAARMGYSLLPAHAVSSTVARPAWAMQQPPVQHIDQRRTQNVTLNGAHQSLAEQRADLLRHMTAVG